MYDKGKRDSMARVDLKQAINEYLEKILFARRVSKSRKPRSKVCS
jgi:hypothetical protein